jgi:hypothetical protein
VEALKAVIFYCSFFAPLSLLPFRFGSVREKVDEPEKRAVRISLPSVLPLPAVSATIRPGEGQEMPMAVRQLARD